MRASTTRILYGVSAIVGASLLGTGSALAADNSVPLTPSLVAPVQRTHSNTDQDADARKRLPWFATASIYFPTFNVGGISSDTGFEGAIGYIFPVDSGDVRVSARGQSYGVSGGGASATVSISAITFEYLFRFEGFSVGPGISFGSAQVSNDFGTVNTDTQAIFSVAADYDINRRWFAEARWQTASEDGYRAFSVGLGYRF
ncbi:MAG: hypothetical protein P4L46_06285 [Fimbriimonas sp.]|nr:hypothetical protein [Fimbriimonas sp.]